MSPHLLRRHAQRQLDEEQLERAVLRAGGQQVAGQDTVQHCGAGRRSGDLTRGLGGCTRVCRASPLATPAPAHTPRHAVLTQRRRRPARAAARPCPGQHPPRQGAPWWSRSMRAAPMLMGKRMAGGASPPRPASKCCLTCSQGSSAWWKRAAAGCLQHTPATSGLQRGLAAL